MHLLNVGEDLRSPCVFVLYVETREDVEALRELCHGTEVVPLREDIEKYTNCIPEWTVGVGYESTKIQQAYRFQIGPCRAQNRLRIGEVMTSDGSVIPLVRDCEGSQYRGTLIAWWVWVKP